MKVSVVFFTALLTIGSGSPASSTDIDEAISGAASGLSFDVGPMYEALSGKALDALDFDLTAGEPSVEMLAVSGLYFGGKYHCRKFQKTPISIPFEFDDEMEMNVFRTYGSIRGSFMWGLVEGGADQASEVLERVGCGSPEADRMMTTATIVTTLTSAMFDETQHDIVNDGNLPNQTRNLALCDKWSAARHTELDRSARNLICGCMVVRSFLRGSRHHEKSTEAIQDFPKFLSSLVVDAPTPDLSRRNEIPERCSFAGSYFLGFSLSNLQPECWDKSVQISAFRKSRGS